MSKLVLVLKKPIVSEAKKEVLVRKEDGNELYSFTKMFRLIKNNKEKK